MHLHTPYTILDCHVALFPAWQDGMPKRGPAPTRHATEPLMQCVASVAWQRGYTRRAAAYGAVSSAQGRVIADTYDITVTFPEGVVYDDVGRSIRSATGDKYVLVAIFYDEDSQQWQRYQFFHVTLNNDGLDASSFDSAMPRTLTLRAGHLDEDAGQSESLPSLAPKVYGYVEWISGSMRIPALRFDDETNKWSSMDSGNTGLENQPYALWDDRDVSTSDPDLLTFSLFQPRSAEREDQPGRLGVVWQQRLFFSLDRSLVPVAATGTITRNSAPAINSYLNLAGAFLQFWDGSFLDLPGIIRVISPYSAEDIAFSINNGDGHTFEGANGPHVNVSATWSGDVVTVTARTPGSAGNSLAIGTNPAFATSGATLTGGSDAAPGPHNLLILHAGIQLECNGSPEPIEKFIQDPLLEESYAIFRVLDRVYMTVGHDRIAVPRISSDAAPLTPNFQFRLGETVLDDTGWWGIANEVPYVTSPSEPITV